MRIVDHIKFLLNIIVFFLSFAIFCVVATFIMRPLGYDSDNISGFYGEEPYSLDVVYIGGSACFTYWMPIEGYKNAGITSYNYAANTAPPEVYRYWAMEIKKTQNPKLLIFDARAFQWRKKYPTSRNMEVAYRVATTYMRYGSERATIINDLIPNYLSSGQDLASYHFDLAKYHSRRDGVNIREALQKMFGTYKNTSRGFLFVDEIEPIQKTADSSIAETAQIDTEESLKQLLEYLNDNNQKALFIISPYAETIDEKQEINTIEKIVTAAGFDFLDTNDYVEKIGIDYEKDFYNSQHTNPSGAMKYSAFLSEYLKTHYDFADKRGKNEIWDSSIQPWNDMLNNHLQILEEKHNATI